MSSITSPGVQRVPTSAGTAIPAGGTLNIIGAGGITTSAAGSTVTVDGSGITGGVSSLTGNTGGALTGALNLVGSGILSVAGAASTLTISLTNPIPIANGGTNATSMANTFGVNYFDGTRLVTTAVGTATNVLTSNGAGVAPTFQALPASGVSTIAGDTGTATGSTITFNAASNAGSSMLFNASASTVSLKVTDASNNTLLGNGAGNATLTATGTCGFGFNNLHSVTSGAQNSAFGCQSMASNLVGQDNCAFGFQALSGSDGNNNCAFGWHSLLNGTAPANNCAFGSQSLANLDSGTQNTCLGFNAGVNYSTTESRNIILGQTSGTALESGVTRIGNGSSGTPQSACYIEGISGVSVSNANMVTINTSTGQMGSQAIPTTITWSAITANQAAAVNKGYICNKAGTLTLSLPASSVVGDIIEVTGINTALGRQITQGAGQQIFFGASSTTSGASGTLTSSATRDSIKMVCVVANLTWNVLSSVGNPTIA